jgi:hypothetical protein
LENPILRKPIIADGIFRDLEDVFREFGITRPERDGIEVLFAAYNRLGHSDYEYHAFVLYRKGGSLYEIEATHSHTSSLRGRWKALPTSPSVIRRRVTGLVINNSISRYSLQLLPLLLELEIEKDIKAGQAVRLDSLIPQHHTATAPTPAWMVDSPFQRALEKQKKDDVESKARAESERSDAITRLVITALLFHRKEVTESFFNRSVENFKNALPDYYSKVTTQ